MIKLIREAMVWIHRVIPKRNHAIVYGWPDFEDNVIALEQELTRIESIEVYMLLENTYKHPPWKIGPATHLIRKNSLKGLWLFLRAKYVFFTHPCFVRRYPHNVISVNVWHGMPIKRIGRLLTGSVVIHSSHLIATSTFWSGIMRQSMPAQQLLPDCGLPRNDRLFSDPNRTLDKLGCKSTERLVFWLPTYRTSALGETRQDGHEYGNVFELPGIDTKQLNQFLKDHNAILLTKPHPMAVPAAPEEFSNLKIIDNSWLLERKLSLYEALGSSNLLISDISSVVIDYLLLDRPIIHAFPDIEQYRNSRGFSVEPIEGFFAGEVVNDPKQLLAALEIELAGKDPHAKKRRALRDLSHTHQDNKATQRLLEAVGLKTRS